MKTYNFYKLDTGEFMGKKKCSLMEARIYAHNFGYKFEEHKKVRKSGKAK